MSARVLIIGGTRFLGLAIAESFISKGYEVYEMNRGTRKPAEGIVEQLVCDKSDLTAFANVLEKYSWDIIVDTILTDEDLRFAIDVLGTDVGHFIHTGSLGVYGEARQIPAKETLPLSEYEGDEIVFNYKIKQDQVLVTAFNEKKFPATIMRMSYIYGSGDIPLDAWGGRSKEFFKMLKDGEKIILPENGRALLHPGHVKDLGRSFLHAAENSQVSIGQAYNIGGSHALMMRDYAAALAEAMGVELHCDYAPIEEVVKTYPGIVNEGGMKFACQHMCASIEKAEKDLSWRPLIPLKAGLRENIDWMLKNNII